MPDPAHVATDAEIAKIEQLIAKEYKKAHKQVTAKMDDYLARLATKDAKWQQWVANGTKSQAEYTQWKKGQVLMGQRWSDLKDSLAQDYVNAAKISQSIANGYRPEVYAINHNYATFEIEKKSQLDTSYTLYSRESVERMYRDNPRLYHRPGQTISQQIKEGKLARWDKRRIQSVITQGILQGESIPNLTKRLEQVTGGDHKAAIRNIRTMMTGVQNAGRVDAQERAKKMGIPVRKQWLATLDSRTRHWHRDLDGKIVETDEPFVHAIPGNFNAEIMFPGDPEAAPVDIYNCRCTILSAIKGYEIDTSNTDLRHDKNLGKMSYDEWLDAKAPVTSNPIDLPEKKAAAYKQAYINEYAGGHGGQGGQHAHTAAEGQAIVDQYNQEQQAAQAAKQAALKAQEEAAKKAAALAADPQAQLADIQKKMQALEQNSYSVSWYGSWTPAEYSKHKKKVDEAIDHFEKFSAMYPNNQNYKDYVNNAKKLKAEGQQYMALKADAKKLEKKVQSAAKKEMKALDKNTYSNIWKDPVKPSDYAAKKDAISAKFQYFEEQITLAQQHGWTDKEAKFTKLWDELADFEKKGQQYEKLSGLAGTATKAAGKSTFSAEAFTADRKSKAKRFSNRIDADKFHRPNLDKNWDSLTEKEKYAVWEYTHNSNPMNKSLSGYHDGWSRNDYIGMDKTVWGHEDSWRHLSSSSFAKKFGKNGTSNVDYKRTISDLTKAIDKTPLKEDAWFVRGSDTGGLAGLLEGKEFTFDQAKQILESGDTDTLRKAFKGKVFQGHSFLSTGIAKGSGFSGDCMYDIYAPAGTKCIYAEPASYFGNTIDGEEIYKKGKAHRGVGGEAETIFQRGTYYRMADITKEGGTIKPVLEVVDQPDYFKFGDEDTFNGGKTRHKK